MKISRASAVLLAERVEATRDWFMKVGFTVFVDIPEDDHLGFVLLEKDGVQVMVETRANKREPDALRMRMKDNRNAILFIEVDDLDAVIAKLEGSKVLVPRHKTFYGSEEQSYLEPGGNIVTFAKFDRPA
jgi:hypothetical protein